MGSQLGGCWNKPAQRKEDAFVFTPEHPRISFSPPMEETVFTGMQNCSCAGPTSGAPQGKATDARPRAFTQNSSAPSQPSHFLASSHPKTIVCCSLFIINVSIRQSLQLVRVAGWYKRHYISRLLLLRGSAPRNAPLRRPVVITLCAFPAGWRDEGCSPDAEYCHGPILTSSG